MSVNGEAVWRMNVPPLAAGASDPAFERLFLAEYARVVGVAARVLGSRSQAEDVAQEAFLSLHRRGCSAEAWAGGWVAAAAAHGALNVIRGEKRRVRREQAVASEPAGIDPAAAAEAADERRAVRRALARLPRRTATVLLLRHSGFSYAEVAAALGVKQNAVGTMVRRGESALRKEVDRAASQ